MTGMANTYVDPYKPLPRPVQRRKGPSYFVVHGRGTFPMDMLRYDRAWAVTKVEDPRFHHTDQQERSVIIATWEGFLTDARWNSFGWGVIEKLKEKPGFVKEPDDAHQNRTGGG